MDKPKGNYLLQSKSLNVKVKFIVSTLLLYYVVDFNTSV